MSVLIVGSIGLDNVTTPAAAHTELLGGSASYAALAASFFSPVRLVGIVGADFPQRYLDLYQSRGIDLGGLQRVPGKTFTWSGEYEVNLNNRRTTAIDLGVFATFRPDLPEAYRDTPFVLLANIAPSLQSHVLDQVNGAKFVVADTMDLWINTAREDLLALLKRVDMLILNDSEARELTGCDNVVRAGRLLQELGPRFVAVKKGEHGCLLFGPNGQLFAAPAYPLDEVHDPTGAGDCFAGGLVGHLAASGDTSFDALKHAVISGSTVASYNVQAFSTRKLEALQHDDIHARRGEFAGLTRF
jgi:sugar/nucleoside kinase (ribokinase family)